MKKKIALATAVALVVFFFVIWHLTGGGGNTSSCERVIGESQIYTSGDIEKLMDVVEQTFRQEFKDCYLITLEYDESLSQRYCDDFAVQYDADRAIVLTSVFDVGPGGGDGSFHPNSTYSNWQWIFTQTGQEDWILQTWGY